MVNFQTQRLTPHIVRINGMFHERMYLVEGSSMAALIDSGSGYGSLLDVVKHLTDKPVFLILTHGHVDHAMGAAEFSIVYMSHKDIRVFLQHSGPAFRRRVIQGMPAAKRLGKKDMLPPADPAHFLDIKGGDSFDLGGIHLDLYDCAGHTPGSIVVLVREERTLLVGDACSNFTFMASQEALAIPLYEENLKKLKLQLAGKFDTVLEAHGTTGDLPAGVIDGVIRVCEEIRFGHPDNEPCVFAGYHGVLAKRRVPHTTRRIDGKSGNIFYIPQQE